MLYSSPTCFAESTLIGPDKIIITAVFLSLAFMTFLAMRRNIQTKYKIGLIYAHLIFLFFPVMLLTANGACGTLCLHCHENYLQLFAIALPATMAIATTTGMLVIPGAYLSRRKMGNSFVRTFVRRHSRKMGIKAPQLYLIDSAKPAAFSFRSIKSGIFMSVGMLESFTRREIEAVLLHELAHIKQRSSMMKMSSMLMKMSPFSLAGFHDKGKEEADADNFAVRVQGTSRHVNSAKRKMMEFERVS